MADAQAHSFFRSRPFLYICLATGCAGAIALIAASYIWVKHPELISAAFEFAKDSIQWLQALASQNGLYLFLCIALLPAISIPLSPFLILCGIHPPLTGFCIGLSGMLVCSSISYLLTNILLRKPIQALVKKAGYSIPQIEKSNQWKITFLLRLVPGTPFPFQNYILSLAGIRYPIFIGASALTCSFWVIIYVFLGQAFFEGSMFRFFSILAFIVVLSFLLKKLKRKAPRTQ